MENLETAIVNPTLDQRIIKIQFHLQNMANSAIEIGKELIECKKEIGHGNWQNWLKDNFSLSQDTATNFMHCAERFANSETSRNLNFSQMVTLLKLPAAETEKFIEEKAAEGKPVEDMTVKKLREEVKQYKRSKEAQDAELARIQAINQKNVTRADKAEAKVQSLFADIDQLKKENTDLKKKPPVEIVPADYEENKKALADLQAQLDELKNQPPLIKEPEDYQQLKEEKARLENEIAQLQTQKTIEIVAPADYDETKKAVAELQDKLSELQQKLLTAENPAGTILLNKDRTNWASDMIQKIISVLFG